MTKLSTNIDGRIYHINCASSDYNYLQELTVKLNQEMAQLRSIHGDLHHQQVLLMLNLLNLQKIEDLQAKYNRNEKIIKQLKQRYHEITNLLQQQSTEKSALSDIIIQIAQNINNISQELLQDIQS